MCLQGLVLRDRGNEMKHGFHTGPFIISNQHGRVGLIRMHFAHLVPLAYYADRLFLFFLLLLSPSLLFCLSISYYVFFMVWLLYVNVP